MLTVNVFAVFWPDTSILSIANVSAELAARPTTLTFEPTLKPAPPCSTSILLITPENTSVMIASADVVDDPPVMITGSPTL